MTPLAIVEDLNSFSNGYSSSLRRHQGSAVDQFEFQSAEETFSDSIISAIVPTAHTAGDSSLIQRLLIGLRGILAAPVTMEEQT